MGVESLKQEIKSIWEKTKTISIKDIEYRKKAYKENNLPQSTIDRHLADVIPDITKQIFFVVREGTEVNVVSLYANSLTELMNKVKEHNWEAAGKMISDGVLIFVKKKATH